MGNGLFEGLGSGRQLETAEAQAHDTRPRIPTGWPEVDDLLNRGGFAPGHLAVMVGKTHTRKTSVALNWVVRMLKQGVNVGFVGLDEPTPQYVLKTMSAWTGTPHEDIENAWDDHDHFGYEEFAQNYSLTIGSRPGFDDLSAWLDIEDGVGRRPRVVFIDYLGLLARDQYHGQDVNRIPRVFEELKVWTSEQEVTTVALHHVARVNEGSGARYHGDVPLTLESLKYGGEEIVDLAFGTYRPSLNRLGNMTREQAEADYGEDFDDEKWQEARSRVARHKDHTFIQLLKNRPGVRLELEGIQVTSLGESMRMLSPSEQLEDSRMVGAIPDPGDGI